MVVIGAGQTRANNSHVDNSEIIEFTAATRASFTVKARAQFWNACADGTRKTYVAMAWDLLPASAQ